MARPSPCCPPDAREALLRGLGWLVADHPVLGRLDSDRLRRLTDVARLVELEAGQSRWIASRAEMAIVLTGTVVVMGDGAPMQLRPGGIFGGSLSGTASPTLVRCRRRAALAVVPLVIFAYDEPIALGAATGRGGGSLMRRSHL